MLGERGIGALGTLALVFHFNVSAQAQTKTEPVLRGVGGNTPVDCDTVGDNLLINCGFESGDFAPGWTLSGPDPVHNFVSTTAAHSGSFGAQLGSVQSFGCISQTVTTTFGQLYTLSFWLSNSLRPNNFQVFWGPGDFPAKVSGDLLNMPDFDYTKYTITGLFGSGSLDRVEFCAEFVRVRP